MPESTKVKTSILIYRDTLLMYSEPWILSQPEAFVRYQPYYAGTRRIESVNLDALGRERVAILDDLVPRHLSPFLRVVYKLTGLAWPAWAQRIRRWQPALIHAHFGPDGVWARGLAKMLGVPLIVTFHGYDITVPREKSRAKGITTPLYFRRRLALFHEAARIIAVSTFIRERLLAEGCPPEKVVVHHIGVDTQAFDPGPVRERPPVILFVGRLVEQKGIFDLLCAVQRVQKHLPEARLIVAGDGPLRAEVERASRALPRPVSFLGRVSQAEVRRLLEEVRVFCVPSIVAKDGAAEGFGIVFAEAQAMGVPVVSYATGGIQNAVEHGVTGFLAPPGDIEALAGMLEHVLREPFERWLERSRAARRRVVERFDLHTQSRALERLYDDVRLEAHS